MSHRLPNTDDYIFACLAMCYTSTTAQALKSDNTTPV